MVVLWFMAITANVNSTYVCTYLRLYETFMTSDRNIVSVLSLFSFLFLVCSADGVCTFRYWYSHHLLNSSIPEEPVSFRANFDLLSMNDEYAHKWQFFCAMTRIYSSCEKSNYNLLPKPLYSTVPSEGALYLNPLYSLLIIIRIWCRMICDS